VRAFRRIFCADISEFESYLPSHAVSLCGLCSRDRIWYVPWGEWFQPTAFRKNVRDILKFRAPIFWNVKVT
jgi:hypothetical protein